MELARGAIDNIPVFWTAGESTWLDNGDLPGKELNAYVCSSAAVFWTRYILSSVCFATQYRRQFP